jgi:hypothetical protein
MPCTAKSLNQQLRLNKSSNTERMQQYRVDHYLQPGLNKISRSGNMMNDIDLISMTIRASSRNTKPTFNEEVAEFVLGKIEAQMYFSLRAVYEICACRLTRTCSKKPEVKI